MVKSALVKDQSGCSCFTLVDETSDATLDTPEGPGGTRESDINGLEGRRDDGNDPCDGRTDDPAIGSLLDMDVAEPCLEKNPDMSGPDIFLLNASNHLWPFFS